MVGKWFVLALGLAPWPVQAATDAPPSRGLTVLVSFDAPHSAASFNAMKTEAQALLRKAHVRLDWQLRGEAGEHAQYEDVVVFRMKGRCAMEPVDVLLDERGPLAMTYASDGAVLPFGEVSCERVRHSIRRALVGDDFRQGDALLGRALGRVMAHEVYHMLARTKQHTGSGVTRSSLSDHELLAPAANWTGGLLTHE